MLQLPAFSVYVHVPSPLHVSVVHVRPSLHAYAVNTHAPAEQLSVVHGLPSLQTVSVGAYVHVPPEHVPVEAYVRRVVPVVQIEAGGVVQDTGVYVQTPAPVQLSVVHALLSLQTVSVNVEYVHVNEEGGVAVVPVAAWLLSAPAQLRSESGP